MAILPQSGLVIDSKGNLYGTTYDGGNGTCLLGNSNIGCGVVFELSQSDGSWSETVLYNFQGGKDGRNPNLSPMTFDAEGNLYGVTDLGGGTGCPPTLKVGCGVLFKLTPPAKGGASWTEKILHRFTKKTGTYPYGNLLCLNGSLYGTTSSGGADGFGTAYESTLKGKVTVINNFTGASGGSTRLVWPPAHQAISTVLLLPVGHPTTASYTNSHRPAQAGPKMCSTTSVDRAMAVIRSALPLSISPATFMETRSWAGTHPIARIPNRRTDVAWSSKWRTPEARQRKACSMSSPAGPLLRLPMDRFPLLD